MNSCYNFKNYKTLTGAFFASSPFITNKLLYNSIIVILDSNESTVSALKINQNRLNNDEYYAYPLCEGSSIDEKKTMIMHDYDARFKNSEKIMENVFVTDFDEKINFYPEKYYVSSGYMSWLSEDFMRDVKNSDWIPIIGSSKLIFDTPIVQRWHEAYKTCKIRPEMIQSGHAYC